jgi:glycine/D-amino acid oxidase-like deaminating enzyme
VAVVGGGILGISTAAHLARAHADVVQVTEYGLASGASGRSLSWLNSAGIYSAAYHRLRMAGIDRYRTLAAQHPGADWLRFDGGLAWPADVEELLRIHEHGLAYGYDTHRISADRVAGLTPGVDPAAIPGFGAIWNPGEGWVDLPTLARLLAEELIEAGGQLVTAAGRCTLLTDGQSVTGVGTEGGDRIEADATVLATGAEVPAMAAEVGLTIPDGTPVSLLVTTKPVRGGLRAVLNTPRASMRPTPGGGLAVDSDWTIASITRSADGSYQVPEAVLDELLAEASRLLSGGPRLEVDRYAMGPKPVPGDGQPVLGRVDDVPGLFIAFSHSGATLGLIAGELLAYEITSGSDHPMLADFNVRRFG